LHDQSKENILKQGIIISLLLSCAACATATSIAIRAPDGSNWIGIDCSGHSQNACLAEAGIQCPGGYDLIDNEGHVVMEAKASLIATPDLTVAGAHTYEVHSGSMIIKCHGKSLSQIEAEEAGARKRLYQSQCVGQRCQ
jgi:hypothetical protein